MWMPVAMIVLPELVAHAVSGWVIDRFGVKLAMILSGLLVAFNSIHLIYCNALPEFVLLFALAVFGGSLFNNAWPTLVVKLAPTHRRPEYIATLALVTAPGAIVSSLFGCLLVKWTGYDYVFWVSCAGGLASVVLYMLTLQDIRKAPQQ
jgi:DHA2 family multidrug resistance protein-like MFS transporter